ncbi:thioredoxin domain-containing protein [Sinorhizobium meliloti]|nr:thioredoxin domain-containing protein [Sinorhizobium meliloti]
MSRKTREMAQARVAAAQKKRKRRNIIRSVIVTAAFSGVVYAAFSYITTPLDASAKATWDTAKVYPTDITFGDPKAPVRITEYGSLTCIHCSQFHNEALPDFLKNYVDTGKAYLVFRHFPYDASGLAGAQAVSCLPATDRAKAVSVLMQQQGDWMTGDKPGLAALDLFGLSPESRRKAGECVEKGIHAEAIGQVTMEARQNGIASTPTFVVGDKVYPGFMGATALGRIVDLAPLKSPLDQGGPR